MKFTPFEAADLEEVEPPRVHGPVLPIRKAHEHHWELEELLNEGGHISLSVKCLDPCSIPHDWWTGKTCSCEWVAEHVGGEFDFFLSGIPIALTQSGGYWEPYSGEWEPVLIEGGPLQSSMLGAAEKLRDLSEAVRDYLGGRDLFEECSNVSQTYAGDYDCDGCSACGLYHDLVAAEDLLEKIENLDSRSRADVPTSRT